MDSNDLLNMLDDTAETIAPHDPTKVETSSSSTGGEQKSFSGKAKKESAWEKEHEPLEVKKDSLLRFNRMFTVVSFGEVPGDVSLVMNELTAKLMEKSFTYRSPGDKKDILTLVVDKAAKQRMTYMLAWPGMNKEVTTGLKNPTDQAFRHAAFYHKAFKKIPGAIKAITARNTHLMLGEELNTPVNLLICYSSDGVETMDKIDFKTTGNAAYFIQLAEQLDIPVFNLGNATAKARVIEFLETFK